MIRRLTYNCDPESLGDVTKEEFVDAFENVIYTDPRLRESFVKVTFQRGASGLVSMADDEKAVDLEEWDETIDNMADIALDQITSS